MVLVPALLLLSTCGKDSPTKPQPPEPTPPPPPPVATRIEVTPSTATLNAIGQTVQLTAKVLDQNNNPMAAAVVNWTSSADGVATVSAGGLVTAVMNGAAVITARSGNVSATVNVTVSQTARTLAIEPEMATLTSVGQTIQLTATVLDQKEQIVADAVVTWESSDESVATVDARGLVTAVNFGTARITARSGNASADIEVKVVQSVGSIAIEPDEAIIQYIGATVKLEATVLDPDGQPIASVVVTWESSDENVATVDAQGLVTAVMNGVVQITARVGNVKQSIRVTVEASPPTTEREVLVAFYYSTGGPEWKNNTNWLSAEPISDWYGVLADLGDVDGLELDNNGLKGTIPAQLAQLSRMSFLSLQGNQLTGSIPPELGTLSILNFLDLSDNNLTGSIPGELGELERLYTLFLDNNNLTGSIPANLTKLNLFSGFHPDVNWTGINLGRNQLTGQIPPELGNMDNVQFLSLSHNRLTGNIPPELGQFNRIHTLDLSGNQLTGRIPPEFGNLSTLEYLRLNDNPSLSGTLPLEMIELENLRGLYLEGTKLCVPSVFEEWAGSIENANFSYCQTESVDRDVLIAFYHAAGGENWTTSTNWLSSQPLNQWFGVSTGADERVDQLSLANNNLTGTITPVLGRLSALRNLNLGDNPSLDGQLPLELANLPLESIRVAGTNLCTPADVSFQSWFMQVLEGDGVANCDHVIQMERNALIDLYHATNGPGWRFRDNWLSGQPMGTWFGVSTDREGRVTALNLDTNRLRGMLPAELGRLTRLKKLQLSDNNLSGPIPPEIGNISELTEIRFWGNQLTGSIPPEIGKLQNLTVLELTSNQLSGEIPPEIGQLISLRWLQARENQLSGTIPPEVGKLENLSILELTINQLTGTIPPEIGKLNSLEKLDLGFNQLEGQIPPEIGLLRSLEYLELLANQLSGKIPSEIGQLSSLVELLLTENQLTGAIPPEIGNMNALETLWLNVNQLSGDIPREIGQLANLKDLLLDRNQLSGEIPSEIGDLSALVNLWLFENQLSGEIPPELGQLGNLIRLLLDNNQLSGSIPPELGNLDALWLLHLEHNQLSGGIPPELGEMDKLYELKLSYNENLSGPIPQELTTSTTLRTLFLEGTQICAPENERVDEWLGNLEVARVERCGPPAGSVVYLTQATQSLDYPVPLVAGEDALLRVFVTADEQADAGMPPVRATFFQDGAEIHTVDIAGQESSIRSTIDEGSLASSANVSIPGWIIAPGLELVVEIDPDGTLGPPPGIQARIPETGRLSIDVRNVPGLDLTVVPLIWSVDPDYSVVAETQGLTTEDDLFRATRYLLPVRDIDFSVTVREPVFTGVQPVFDNHDRLIREIKAIRVMDGGNGHYMGVLQDFGGATTIGGRSLVANLHEGVIAHEIGHTFNLFHAPCGTPGDPRYPYRDGSIGAWGYDILDNVMVPPDTPDVMSFCLDNFWISDYHFRRAMLHRIREAASRQVVSGNAASRVLLVWGGVGERDGLVIEPSFVVDAPPYVPNEGGPYRLAGYDGRGNTLFTLNFAMDEIVDGDEGGSFAYTIPVRSDWSTRLLRITLSGPEGDAELTRDGEFSTSLLLDQFTGEVRGFMRDDLPSSGTPVRFTRRAVPDSGLDVVVSPGIPASSDW